MVTTLRAAARSFRSDRAFAVAIVATIALGFAPTCMVFTLMDSLYFRPLPYPEQHRLALLNTAHPSTASLDEIDPFTFQEWRHKTTAIVTAAVYRSASFALNDGDRPELVPGQYVTADFFRTLGAMPAIGRAPTAADCAPGAPRVVVISDRFWREYFAHRDGIIGSVVRVDSVPATVVGVMPAGFVSFMEGRAARVWTPLARDNEATPSDARGGNAIVRLQNTSSLAQAQAELESVRTTLARQYPEFYRDRALVLRDFRASLFGGLGPGIRVLSVMVGLLLLIACGNAANLLLARAARCTGEVAIRSALGASRLRLIGASLAESVALTSVAAVPGLVLAWAGSRLLWSATAPIFRHIGVDGLPVDWRAVAFTFLLALVTALLTGLWPSFRGSRTDLVAAFGDSSRGTGRTSGRGRMSRALVVGQVALCVLTMIGATLVTENVIRFLRASTVRSRARISASSGEWPLTPTAASNRSRAASASGTRISRAPSSRSPAAKDRSFCRMPRSRLL